MALKFTNKDLKTGDVVVTRDGDIGVVIVEKDTIFFKSGWFILISRINENLTGGPFCANADIMRVYRHARCFKECRDGIADLIYDREKIENVEEMTLEEVCNALGKNIKIVKEHDND